MSNCTTRGIRSCARWVNGEQKPRHDTRMQDNLSNYTTSVPERNQVSHGTESQAKPCMNMKKQHGSSKDVADGINARLGLA